MCLRLNAARITVPSGDRLGTPAFSGAGPDEGHQNLPRRPILKVRPSYFA
jgi:hypothetical protein